MEYRIKQVSDMTGLSSHTLRYYEKEGILPPIKRDRGGRRAFTEENLVWLDIVTCLKKTSMPVADIKKIVSLSIQGDETIEERKEILEKHRHIMETQKKELDENIRKIDKKIAFYNGADMC